MSFLQKTIAFMVVAAFVMCGVASSAPLSLYSITALDVLPGSIDSLALGLNEKQQIVGNSRLDRSGHIGQSRPVVWGYNGVPTELWIDPFVGGSAADINNNGMVVGRYGSGSGTPLPGPGVPFGRGFVWDSTGGRRDLGLEPVGNTQAVAINDTGQVVGTSEVLMEIEGSNFFVPRAFVWDETNGIENIGTLGGNFSFANDVNEIGQVVGYGENAAGFERAFIWDALNGIQELPPIAEGETRAVAINDFGLVLGSEAGIGGVLWNLNTGIVIPVPGGLDLNNVGQAVGGPFIVDDTTNVQELLGLIYQGSGWEIDFASAINNSSQIVGYGQFNGETQGFFLTSVPEPSTWACVAIVACLVLLRRNKCGRMLFANTQSLHLSAGFALAVLILLGTDSESHAEIIRFRMTGTVTVDDPTFVLPPDVVTGAPFTALLTYDTSVPDSLPDDPNRGRYKLNAVDDEFSLSLFIGSLHLQNTPIASVLVQVFNDVPVFPFPTGTAEDTMFFTSHSIGGPGVPTDFSKPGIGIFWGNPNLDSWDSDALPTVLNPTGLRRAEINAISGGEPLPLGRPYSLIAFVAHVEVIPEPESIVFLVIAIGTLTATRRWKRISLI